MGYPVQTNASDSLLQGFDPSVGHMFNTSLLQGLDQGVGHMFSTALLNFPLDFTTLVELSTALAMATSDSASKVCILSSNFSFSELSMMVLEDRFQNID